MRFGIRRAFAAVGYTIVFAALVGYFAWICIEMSGHVLDGGEILVATFGATAVGTVALLLGGAGRRERPSARAKAATVHAPAGESRDDPDVVPGVSLRPARQGANHRRPRFARERQGHRRHRDTAVRTPTR